MTSQVSGAAATARTHSPSAAVAYAAALEAIAAAEPDVAAAIAGELASQRRQLKLIASENYASPAVLLAMGNWLSDKYAEGTVGPPPLRRLRDGRPGRVDRRRARPGAVRRRPRLRAAAFGHRREPGRVLVDPGPPGGAPALQAAGVRHVNDLPGADWERLRTGLHSQRMLGMALDAGGHLTHGFRPNISGKLFEQASYGTDPETGLLDYDAIAALAREFRPLVLVAGYSAYPRTPNFAGAARDRRRGRRHPHGGHGALRGPGRGRRADRGPQPGAARRGGDLDHAQVAARPARRVRAVHRRVRPVRRQGLPDGARRPAAARDGGQGDRVRRGPPALVRRLRVRDPRQRPGAGRRPAAARQSAW